MKNVLISDEMSPRAVERFRAEDGVQADYRPGLPAAELLEVVGRYEALVVRSATKVTAGVIEAGARLQVIGRAGTGLDNVDLEAATRRGVVVMNVPGGNTVSAAEHTIGLMLALSRNIPQAHASVKEGRWERSRYAGQELAGKTLGILGFGRIGQQVARRALALGMRVIAFDPFISRERFRELGVEGAPSLEAVLAESDIVTLHLPLTDETRGVLDRETLAHAKGGMRVVNTARGELVDEEALLEALKTGTPERYPLKTKKAERPHRRGHAYVLTDGAGRVALVRRPDKGLLGGMAGLPTSDWSAAPGFAPPVEGDWGAAGSVEHVFTHFSLTLEVHVAEGEGDFLWTPADEAAKALPTVFRKALERALGTLSRRERA